MNECSFPSLQSGHETVTLISEVSHGNVIKGAWLIDHAVTNEMSPNREEGVTLNLEDSGLRW